jgi:hypothetical protein
MSIIYINQKSAKPKKSKSKKLLNAVKEHEKFLLSVGYDAKKSQKKSPSTVEYTVPKSSSYVIPTSDTIVDGGRATGIMANLYKETPEVQRKILEKANRCMPLYNKGGYQFCSENEDMTQVGSRSRRN